MDQIWTPPAPPQTKQVPLSQLHYGHEYEGAELNCRKTARDADIDVLAASIKIEGLLQSLLVLQVEGQKYYVIAGNRRLAALHKLAEAGEFNADDYYVPVISYHDIDAVDALRKSLAENDHLPLHPVDRFEALAAVHETGASTAEIAVRYAVPERMVKQSLALGRLASCIREAWREGEIDAEEAAVFTMAKDHATQEKAFTKLKKRRALRAWSIRRELVGEQNSSRRLLTFVGDEAYKNAGGAIIEDLFGDNHAVSDTGLLEKLAVDKIKEKCEKLISEGWSWAAYEKDLPDSATYSWQKLPVSAKKATQEQKAESGCIVSLTHDGKFDIAYGVVKPGKKTAKKAKEPPPVDPETGEPAAAQVEETETPAIPLGLMRSLSVQLTDAACEALKTDADIALAVMLAGFLAGQECVDVKASGPGNNFADENDDADAEPLFADVLDRTLKMSRDEKITALAHIAAGALNFHVNYGNKHALQDDDIAAVCAAIPAEALNASVARHFNSQDYFASAPKAVCLQAIEEALGVDAVQPLLNKKKAEIATFAATYCANDGWLPVELRTAHYAGPGVGNKTEQGE